MAKLKLKRDLNLFEAMLAGIGIILGAGIYVLVGKAAGLAGNAVWMSFGIAALVAALSGLSYAELSSIFPKAGAEYVYVEHSLGRRLAFMVGWLIILGGIIASAAVAIGFGGYLNALTGFPILLGSLLLVALISLVLMYGVKISAWLAIIFTLIEATGLIIIVGIGIPHIGKVDLLSVPFGFSGVISAAALIFFAFIGFDTLVRMSEETKNPEKNIPIALLLAIVITTILYVLVAISAISVLGFEALASSSAPLADVAATLFGAKAFVLLGVIALFATSNTVLLLLLATSRITYGMADEHSLPKILNWIHPHRRTPWAAIITVVVLTMAFIFIQKLEFIASLTNMTVYITFIMINIAVIVLRYKPEFKSKFRTPINIGNFPVLPVVAIITVLAMMLSVEKLTILYGVGLFASGFVIYEVARRVVRQRRKKAPKLTEVTLKSKI